MHNIELKKRPSWIRKTESDRFLECLCREIVARYPLFYKTPTDFAKAARIEKASLSRLHGGTIDMRISTLLKIADALFMTPASLIQLADKFGNNTSRSVEFGDSPFYIKGSTKREKRKR